MSTTFNDPFLATQKQEKQGAGSAPSNSADILARARMSRAPAAVRAPTVAADTAPANVSTPFDHFPDGSFAQADPMDAGQMLLIITTDVNPDGSVSLRSDMRQAMRQEMRQWVENIRRRGGVAATELRSPTPRDEAIDTLCAKVVERASKAKSKLWSAALPTGRQIVLVSQGVFDAIGVDNLVRKLHHRAIQVASSNGDPFNDKALAMYEAPTPHAVGVS